MKTKDLVFTAAFTALIAVCAWIAVPAAVPFTLQTFAIFLAPLILGGKFATLAVTVYIALGAVGAPVFAGFTGGIGVLLGKTGGYIVGFVLTELIVWGAYRIFGEGRIVTVISMLTGLLVCYLFGTAWFMVVCARTTGAVAFTAALSWCVLPFIIPDLIKLILAIILGERLKRIRIVEKR